MKSSPEPKTDEKITSMEHREGEDEDQRLAARGRTPCSSITVRDKAIRATLGVWAGRDAAASLSAALVGLAVRSSPGRRPPGSGRRTSSSGTAPPNRAASDSTSAVGSAVRSLDAAVALAPAHERRAQVAGPSWSTAVDIEQTAAGDDADPVGQVLGLVEVVRGQEHRRPAVAQRLEQLPERPPRLRVEAGGRLVEEEQLGPADDAQRDVEPAALAAGQGAGPGAGLRRQADRLDHLVRVARRAGRSRRSGGPARAPSAQPASPVDCSTMPTRARQARSRSAGSWPSTVTSPASRLAEALEDLDGRRLAGAVGPEQREDLPGRMSRSIPSTARCAP